MSARITGLGAHRPAHREDNTAVAARTGSSDTWIRERSGIVTRGVAADGEGVVEMAASAGQKALVDAGLVLLATTTLLRLTPAGAPEVAHRLGAASAGALDLGAACAGFTYGLALAADVVGGGTAEHVLVVGAERFRDVVDPHDRTTAFLFGDGAGAAVVSRSDRRGVFPAVWLHDGSAAEAIRTEGVPQVVRMEGRAVYRWATTTVPGLARRACAAAGLELDDLAAFVPHQANLRITEAVVRQLGLPDHVAVADDVVDSGNTSGASVPLALARLREQGRVSPGDPVLLAGFGAGLTAAAQVVLCP